MKHTGSILVIDDEQAICYAFGRFFERRGWAVRSAASGGEGLASYRRQRADMVFLDVRLPDGNGLDVLEELCREDPEARVVIITAYGSLETVTRAVRNRAFEYLVKPLDLDRAIELAERAIESRAALSEVSHGTDDDGDVMIVGASAVMQEVYKRIGLVAHSDASVLIAGDTGTGKELVARAIHEHSARKDKPFVAINCGAIPESLVESELFGYARGAFTGADSDRAGRFESADGGTLLLDEVGELPAATQTKLLRFLDSQTIERLGSAKPIRLDVRILAATNLDLAREVESGRFRSDLYYRLAVIQIELPPLRNRPEDILPLARHFLAAASGRKRTPPLSNEAGDALNRYQWPGNVRELKNAVEHAAVVSGGEQILPAHLPESVRQGRTSPGPTGRIQQIISEYIRALPADGEGLHAAAVKPLEKALLRHALETCRGNQSEAADLLGLHRNTLRRKLRELGIDARPAN